MPSYYHFTSQELNTLKLELRHASDKRYADRVKTVYLLGKGWLVGKVVKALVIDRENVRIHYKRYRNGGLDALRKNEVGGSLPMLSESQQRALDDHLQANQYLTAKESRLCRAELRAYGERDITQLLRAWAMCAKSQG